MSTLKNNFTKTNNPLSIRIKNENGSTKEATLEAVFVPAAAKVVSNDYRLGTAKIDNVENAVGDKITVTAVYNTPHATWQSAEIQNHSKAVTFDGWYENGVCLSQDETMSYTITQPTTLEARFSRKFEITADNTGKIRGYYRMAPPFAKKTGLNKFLCITGDFAPSINTSSGSFLHAALQYNQVPEGFSSTYAATDSVFSDAGSIIYVTGTKVNTNAVAAQTKVASNIVAEAQGVSTASLFSKASANLSPWLTTANVPGYYCLYLLDGVTMQWTSTTSNATYDYQKGEQAYVSKDHLDTANNRDCGNFDIQPVDLEHIDTNYFGAYPSDEMAFDGGYWTSMYTSFPYECYDEDGVEAWVVNGSTEYDGNILVTIERLESGIVPAATPVLLKCRGLSPKENRLIPLLPDDSRLDEAKKAVEGNLLKGDYGLWTKSDYTGRNKYNDATMRVFSINNNGELGFYRLADKNADLIPNRAYLDLTALSGANKAPAAVRITFDTAGIDNVTITDDADTTDIYYNLQGIRVEKPVPGNLYIRNGKKFIAR